MACITTRAIISIAAITWDAIITSPSRTCFKLLYMKPSYWLYILVLMILAGCEKDPQVHTEQKAQLRFFNGSAMLSTMLDAGPTNRRAYVLIDTTAATTQLAYMP